MSTRRRTADRTIPLELGKIPKPYRPIVRAAVDAGFRLERRNNGHFALWPPAAKAAPILASSPTDGGRITAKKLAADLRRAGLEL